MKLKKTQTTQQTKKLQKPQDAPRGKEKGAN